MREAGSFLQYIPWLIVEIIKANLHVFKLAMTRNGYEEVAPRIVTIKTYLKTDFAKFVFANSITLTPGTITMLIRGDVFHVHTMSQFLEDDLLEGAIERKVAEVFEPDVLKRRKKTMKEWFAIIMGASLLILMIPILYRIVVGADRIWPYFVC